MNRGSGVIAGAALVALGLGYLACAGDPGDPGDPDGSGRAIPDAGASTETAQQDTGPPIDSAVDAGPGAVAWAPSSLAGLVLWLEASHGISTDDGGITQWSDQSGHANHATTLPEAGVRPTVKAAAIGGHPAVHFARTLDYVRVEDSVSMQWGTGDFTVGVVLRHTTPTGGGFGYGAIISKQAAGVPFIGPSLWGNTAYGTGALYGQLRFTNLSVTSPVATYNNGLPFYALLQRQVTDGGVDASVGTLDLRVNGAPSKSASGTAYALDVSAVARPMYIGGTPDDQSLQGDLAELIAIKGTLAPGDRAKLERYLENKYGLGL